MPAPSLRIPLALDMEAFKRETEKASSHVGTTLRLIHSQFEKTNGLIAAGVASGARAYATGWLGAGARVVGVFGAMALGASALASAIAEARRQIEEMVEIADKSRDRGLDPEGFQKFLLVAKNLKVEVSDLEGALDRAFQNTKEKSPVDLSEWKTAGERITDVEKALRVYNLEAKKLGQNLEGLVLFRDAQNQEQKIQAVLAAMVQLNAMGKTLESLDLGERMFGAAFVDRIRQGKTSAEEMLKTMQSASVLSGDLFSNEMVQRAKSIDDELKKAHATLDKNLKPAWDGLASVTLDIKNLWVSIVKLMGDAAGVFNFFSASSELKRLKGDLEDVNKALANGTAMFGLPALSGTERVLTARKTELEALIASAERPAVQMTVNASRGTGAAPTAPSSRDSFERAVGSVEKRTAGLAAEAAAMDLNTAARERARIVAELTAVAIQANAAAGKANTAVTTEQQVAIDRVADAYGRAALAMENARSPLATFARESANVGKALNQFAANTLDGFTNDLASVVTGTKTAAEAFRSMANSIIQDLARIAIRQAITGPIAGALGGLFGGPVGAAAPLIFAPGNAKGTDNWRGGPTWVGEEGPELLNLPRGSQIIPNNIARGMGGSSSVTVTNVIDARNADPGVEGRIMQRLPAVVAAATANAIAGVPAARRNNPRYFG